jgi:hypothetical protein
MEDASRSITSARSHPYPTTGEMLLFIVGRAVHLCDSDLVPAKLVVPALKAHHEHVALAQLTPLRG